MKLFIGSLPYNMTETALTDLFCRANKGLCLCGNGNQKRRPQGNGRFERKGI